VTLKAVVGKDRADLPLEINGRSRLCEQKARRRERKGSGCGASM
jgi:hypothetical protein